MDSQQQFCLKWNSFGSNLATAFGNLFKSESLTDVTLFCEGVTFKAHKLILAACSKHFQDLFETAPVCPSILVILDGTTSSNMSALLEFMYKGEVHVSQDSLPSFLKAAECLQVKGLSIEHEKLALVQGQEDVPNSSDKLDSPTGRKIARLNSSLKEVADSLNNNCGSESSILQQRAEHNSSSMPSPSTHPYSPVHPYMSCYRPYNDRSSSTTQPASSQGYDNPRKRSAHRSPSDSIQESSSTVRASVLRDSRTSRPSSDPEMHYHQGSAHDPREMSPKTDENHSYGHSSPNVHRYDDGPVDNGASASSSVSFDRPAAVDPPAAEGNNVGTPDSLHSSSSSTNVDNPDTCAEDLRIKQEPSTWSTSVDESAQPSSAPSPYKDHMNAEKKPEILSPRLWNSGKLGTLKPTGSGIDGEMKIDSLKGYTAQRTPDGKKLQCPFCERLYGYETNLRAHIRQRHQGIRVPCPFCSRTFTRNNTVRRHIAREHKTELTLKAYQQTQVLNHNP
ncbi:zinc finger protein chinmo [Frankliniella occidentalis]|uniref:Zinc finger protein chinmo n=1 Tax=Frankliniella occidentalis TaxID=133901 RepID=A0A9C6U004_FRAOC|nr:zinc finger protein chinmo [Frankliniella occidentalis]XP_052123611.1 zinc finger protein chinmo [Frankliniella occidentalis]XP_052123612.1 zinc finger protein chinmo [Frankliniella occidentalis]